MAENPSPYTEKIRRFVREKIRRSHGNVSGRIYSKTQDLLRSAAIDIQNQRHLQTVVDNFNKSPNNYETCGADLGAVTKN